LLKGKGVLSGKHNPRLVKGLVMKRATFMVRAGVAVQGEVEAVPVSGLLKKLWRDDCGALLASE
jgi:hypothetical protein